MGLHRIKKNDQVVVISGKWKGRQGKVIKMILPKCTNATGHKHSTKCTTHVLVEGVNLVKKNVKPNPQRQIQGGIVEKEQPLHVSKVALYNPVTKKPGRVGVKVLEDGKKVRYFKSNNELVDI